MNGELEARLQSLDAALRRIDVQRVRQWLTDQFLVLPESPKAQKYCILDAIAKADDVIVAYNSWRKDAP